MYLQAGDRVEIYRALTINPKDIRRKRAEKNPVGRYARGNRLRAIEMISMTPSDRISVRAGFGAFYSKAAIVEAR